MLPDMRLKLNGCIFIRLERIEIFLWSNFNVGWFLFRYRFLLFFKSKTCLFYLLSINSARITYTLTMSFQSLRDRTFTHKIMNSISILRNISIYVLNLILFNR